MFRPKGLWVKGHQGARDENRPSVVCVTCGHTSVPYISVDMPLYYITRLQNGFKKPEFLPGGGQICMRQFFRDKFDNGKIGNKSFRNEEKFRHVFQPGVQVCGNAQWARLQ